MMTLTVDWTFLLVTTIIPVVILLWVLAVILINVCDLRDQVTDVQIRLIKIQSAQLEAQEAAR